MTPQEAWLIDKSALGRLSGSPDTAQWFDRIERGLVRVTTPTVLEVGFSSRSGQDWRAVVREPPVGLLPVENMTPQVEDRALAVQGMLAAEGKHRAPSVADLLIAATAELAGLTVLHVDKDFDLIADITGQRVERLRVA